MRYPLNRTQHQVGYGFGSAWFNTGKLHTGIDEEATAGEPVYAMAAGKLYNHTYDAKWGNGVVLDCGGWGFTLWHVDHMVADGTQVAEDQQIATVYDLAGNTHLHWSVWEGAYDSNLTAGALYPAAFPDRFVDPAVYLRNHQTPQGDDDLTPQTKATLVRLAYHAFLGRKPDAGGGKFWTAAIHNDGSNVDEIMTGIEDSDEAQKYQAALNKALGR